MINFEKYKTQIERLNYCFGKDDENNFFDCNSSRCDNCVFSYHKTHKRCSLSKIKWLYNDYENKEKLYNEAKRDFKSYFNWSELCGGNESCYTCPIERLRHITDSLQDVPCERIVGCVLNEGLKVVFKND